MLFMLLQNPSLVFFDTKSSSYTHISFAVFFFAGFFLQINRAFNNIFSVASCNRPLSSWSSNRYVFLDNSEPKEDK